MADLKPKADPATVIVQLSALLRQAQVYDLANVLFNNAIPSLVNLVRAAADDGDLSIDLAADSFFINKTMVRLSSTSFEPAEVLKRTLARFDVQQVRFAANLTEADLREFLLAYQEHLKSGRAADLKKLAGRVAFVEVKNTAGAAAVIDARQNVLRMYARLAVLLKETIDKAAAGKPFRSPLMRKTVQGLVQASEGRDALLSGLTRFPSFRGELHFHLAAVSALTLLMARRLQLPRTALIDVVMAAAFHDLGRVSQSAGASHGERWISQVPFDSMLLAVRDGFSPEATIQATAAWEVGVPVKHADVWSPSLLGRLIAVPCAFELLTSPPAPARGLPPDQALRVISDGVGRQYDARVVKLFTGTVGVFPVGSTVRLTNGAIAVVLDVPRDAHAFNRPLVKIVRDETGPCDVLLDLATDPAGLAVVAAVDPVDEQVNPTHFLLA